MKKLLFLVNVDWFFLSHRLPIAQKALRSGFEVHIATTITNRKDELESLGLITHDINMPRGNTSILKEISIFLSILKILVEVKPSIFHMVTIKPVIWGGIAARITKTPNIVAAISGLGYIFTSNHQSLKLKKKWIIFFYRIALRHKNLKIIFQNENDKKILLLETKIKDSQATIIKGSGVNLNHFTYQAEPEEEPIRVIMACRLLQDKGTYEFVNAAKLLRLKGIVAAFQLFGTIDPDNPASITKQQIEEWRNEEIVEIMGHCDDIATLFTQSHIVVLPSYREGFPKVLIEAAACGRAVVTTDVPGCRNAIIPNETGLLVPAKDTKALAEAIERLILDKALRQNMGKAGRQLAKANYCINNVIETHMKIYQELLDMA